MVVDTVGSGLLAPFELIYAHAVVGLPLTTAGVALSIAAGAGIAIGPIAGSAVDRWGPTRMVVGANVFGMSGCVALFFAQGVEVFAAGAFLLALGSRTFWAAFTPLVADLTIQRSLDAWFGRLRAMRYVGLAGGEALAGAFLVAGTKDGLKSILVADALSYIVAMVLIALGTQPTEAARSAGHGWASGGYRVVLADRANVALAALNVADTLLIIAPLLAMPVFVIEQLRLDAWLPGLLAACGTGVVAAGTLLASRLLRSRRRLRNMELATGAWAVALLLFVLPPHTRGLSVPILIVAMVLMGLGEALYAPTADALPAVLAPNGLVGRYAALHQMAWGISETIAPLLVATLLADSISLVWTVLAAIACFTLVCYRVLEHAIGGRDGTVS
jgi:MFS family permease